MHVIAPKQGPNSPPPSKGTSTRPKVMNPATAGRLNFGNGQSEGRTAVSASVVLEYLCPLVHTASC